jgi:hydroxymethylbilane synthase
MLLRLGTRASALAQWQAEWVAARLRERGAKVELAPITTTGDRQQGTIRAIAGQGPEQGVFTKEIQRALLDGRIDLAVHSLKDLPTGATPENLPSPFGRGAGGEGGVAPGLCLAAVPERGPVGDVLVCSRHTPCADRFVGAAVVLPPRGGSTTATPTPCAHLECLPRGAVVGTGSLRRRAQLLHVRPDLDVRDVRGNVETRLRKLERADFDALILAEAGLRRLGLAQHITQALPLELMLPAVGQGALALETRGDDHATRELAAALDHRCTHVAVLAERAMLAALQGGCRAPVAALGCVEADQLTLIGRVIGQDGVELLEASESITILPSPFGRGAGGEGCDQATQLGRKVAEALLAQGAGELIKASRTA